jgi:WXG100 family type VII secretion target
MPAAKVRVDYEQLAAIAQLFDRQAEGTQQVLGDLQNTMSTLQGGDWVGKSADRFYAEMNRAVLPALSRAVAAMRSAASATTRISQVLKQAEEDSARLFRLEDAGADNAMLDSAAAGGVSSALPGKARPGGKAGSTRPPVIFTWPRFPFGGRRSDHPDWLAAQLDQFDRQVVDKVFRQLPGADQKIDRLKQAGWKIVKGTKFEVDRKALTITIDGGGMPDLQAAHIIAGVSAVSIP